MKKAQYVGIIWQFLALSAATSIGVLARSYFTTAPASGEQLFMALVTEQFTPILAGFIFCAVLAATISTLDAQLIVCATIITRDLYHVPSGRSEITGTRISITLLTLAAICIAALNTQTLYEIVRYAWSGLGATLGPLVVSSLYTPQRVTSSGALAGMITGGTTTALWPIFNLPFSHAPLIPGFILGYIIIQLSGYIQAARTQF